MTAEYSANLAVLTPANAKVALREAIKLTQLCNFTVQRGGGMPHANYQDAHLASAGALLATPLSRTATEDAGAVIDRASRAGPPLGVGPIPKWGP